jgi:uncharacterized zinc-type alcohol dehydrogenase-like protein
MIPVKGYAAQNPKAPLAPHKFERRELGPHDVLVDIKYCGVCHSDIHMARDEWGGSMYPLVPGHEIVGVVNRVGTAVKKFKAGDLAGVGVIVDSCRNCTSCKQGLEQYCEVHWVPTYSGYEMDMKTITYGGYSNQIVTDENFVLHISNKLKLEGVAPLLCAGITTYSPLRHWKVNKGSKVAVAGLGGLGHMAVKFASAFGAEVTMLSTSTSKQADAKRLGATHFVNMRDEAAMTKNKNQFDVIVNTISAQHNINDYVSLLKLDGTMVMVGIPPEDPSLHVSGIIGKRKSIAGSMIGGVKETQEMLDFCAEKNIVSDVEVIPIKDINTAYERMMKGDVRYRFVIDMSTL